MPNTSDKPTDPDAQLPWDSFVDDAQPARAPDVDTDSEVDPDAEAYARALAQVEDDDVTEEDVATFAALRADEVSLAPFDEEAAPAPANPAGATATFADDPVGYESPVPAEPLIDDLGPPPRGGGWTVTMLCGGIALIACCVLIPQADSNRRLVYESERLKVDLESLKKQVVTNDEFLKRVADDPNLAERLAQRQMKIIRQGTRVLELKRGPGGPTAPSPDDMSPFHLVHVAPPPPLPPYQSTGGRLANICYDPQKRLYLMGMGLFLMAAGLVMGFGPKE